MKSIFITWSPCRIKFVSCVARWYIMKGTLLYFTLITLWSVSLRPFKEFPRNSRAAIAAAGAAGLAAAKGTAAVLEAAITEIAAAAGVTGVAAVSAITAEKVAAARAGAVNTN